MISKAVLRQVLVSNQRDVESYRVIPRRLPGEFPRRVFVGVRRAGKSFMLYQRMQERLAAGHGWESMLYVNFEDDRLTAFDTGDFELLLECHAELYGSRPALYLDEVQTVAGWERFARRLADTQYEVWITGSNASMLSAEMASALGGRYLVTEVYPYSFTEYLRAVGCDSGPLALAGTESRALVRRHWGDYLLWGGLPEAVGRAVKREYLSSTLQKIYLGDVALRNKIASTALLRLLAAKLAESVCRPVSYNRLAHVLSSVSGKITMPTVCRYIECCEQAWLLLRLRNVSSPFAERETMCKYYFVDNGVLNLSLLGGETALLENMVALALFRRYGHDPADERVFYYNDRTVEVDFYVPDDGLALQVSYAVSRSDATFEREAGALTRLPKVLPCRRRLIITADDEGSMSDGYGQIDIVPAWKWLLSLETDCSCCGGTVGQERPNSQTGE